MPVLASSAYNVAGDVTSRLRTILNDSEVVGGDVLTDANPFTFNLLNAGFEWVQLRLAEVGVEVATDEQWLLALPVVSITDPEARLIIDDTGTRIVYPNGVGNVFSFTPQLPVNLVLPLKIWERQNGTSVSTGPPLKQPNGGLLNMAQQSKLVDWEWKADGLRFRGATQVQDIKLLYEKALAKLVLPTDPVPIRGVVNAAAYGSALAFVASRGGTVLPFYTTKAEEEIQLHRSINARRRQRKQVRRRPFSGNYGRQSPVL